MTNPDNIVRVRARNGGRASVYEANGWAQSYTSGLLEGNGVTQNTSADMNVLVGGSSSKPDVVIAQNPAGYKIALDLVGQQAVTITAPASNSRISAIVAYTDDLSLSTTQDTVTGSPASCGLIVVNGTASASPSEPTEAQIRTAITSDGATGSQASYCVIATIEVANDTTIITDSLITIKKAGIGAKNLDFTTLSGNYSTSEQDTGYTWLNGKTIYKKTIDWGSMPNNDRVDRTGQFPNNASIVWIEAIVIRKPGGEVIGVHNMPYISSDGRIDTIFVSDTSVGQISLFTNSDRRDWNAYITLYYTKAD